MASMKEYMLYMNILELVDGQFNITAIGACIIIYNLIFS